VRVYKGWQQAGARPNSDCQTLVGPGSCYHFMPQSEPGPLGKQA